MIVWISQSIEHGSFTPLFAAIWGVASVLLSGCHLTSVPLLVTFLSYQKKQTLSPPKLSGFVTAGISSSLLLVAIISLLVGRILGDLWGVGPWLMIVFLLFGGLSLLDVIHLPSFGTLQPNNVNVGIKSAVGTGATLGAILGPCTFGFFAPILALFGSSKPPALVYLSVSLFVCFHLISTWALGLFGAQIGMKIQRHSRTAKRIKAVIGIVAITIAIHLIITNP